MSQMKIRELRQMLDEHERMFGVDEVEIVVKVKNSRGEEEEFPSEVVNVLRRQNTLSLFIDYEE